MNSNSKQATTTASGRQAVASRIACLLEGSVVANAPADQLTRAQITAFYFGAQRPEAADDVRNAHHAYKEAA